MMPPSPPPRLLRRADSLLLVIDVQERIASAIAGYAEIEQRCVRLISGAQRLKVPIILTEHVPEKLGPTVPAIRTALGAQSALVKATFSACSADPDGCGLRDQLKTAGRSQLVFCGVETHVCVLQTALEALALGYQVFVVEDAVSSRALPHKENALRRIEQAGGVIVNHESVLLEWLGKATDPQFRAILGLVK